MLFENVTMTPALLAKVLYIFFILLAVFNWCCICSMASMAKQWALHFINAVQHKFSLSVISFRLGQKSKWVSSSKLEFFFSYRYEWRSKSIFLISVYIYHKFLELRNLSTPTEQCIASNEVNTVHTGLDTVVRLIFDSANA